MKSTWLPGVGVQVFSFEEVPGQPDLFEGEVLAVLGSSSLAEAPNESEAMKRFSDECYAAFAQTKRGLSCVVTGLVQGAGPLAPPPKTADAAHAPSGRARVYQA